MKMDTATIAVKIHYLTYYGGIGALWPFIPLFARQYGLDALNLGVVSTVGFLLAALLGAALFRLRCVWRNKKTTLMTSTLVLLFVVSLMGGVLNGVEESEDDKWAVQRPAGLYCDETSAKRQMFLRQCDDEAGLGNCRRQNTLSKYFETEKSEPGDWVSGTEGLVGRDVIQSCDIKCAVATEGVNICDVLQDASGCRDKKKGVVQQVGNVTYVTFDIKAEVGSMRKNGTCTILPVPLISFEGKPLWSSCPGSSGEEGSSEAPVLEDCNVHCKRNAAVNRVFEGQDGAAEQWSKKHQWTFGVLAVVGIVMIFLGVVLSDELCLEAIDVVRGNRYLAFLKQWTWGPLGCALAAALSGFAVDLQSDDTQVKDYTACFYVSMGLLGLSAVVDMVLRVGNRPRNMGLQALGPGMASVHLIACFVAGVCFGADWNFSLWMLEDVQLESEYEDRCDYFTWMTSIHGLKVFVDNALGALPMIILACQTPKIMGHKQVPTVALIVIGLRHLATSFVMEHAWAGVPLGVLRNFGYTLLSLGIFRKAFSEEIAKTRGIFAAVGPYMLGGALGATVGSILAGAITDAESSPWAFRATAALALVASVIQAVASYCSCAMEDSDFFENEDLKRGSQMLNGRGHRMDSIKSGESELGWREASDAGAKKKFNLLLWKNFKIQARNKIQMVTEIAITLMFTIALVVIRMLIPLETTTEPTIFPQFAIKGNPPGILRTLTDEIYFTPVTPYTEELIRSIDENYFATDGMKYKFTGFSTEAKMIEAYERTTEAYSEGLVSKGLTAYNATSTVLAGIVFDTSVKPKTMQNIKYTLKFPAYQRTEFDVFKERYTFKPSWFTDLTYHLFRLLGPRSDKAEGGFPGYYAEGFLYLQYAVDTAITTSLLNDSRKAEYEKYDVQMQRFPYPPFTDDKFIFAIQFWLPFFVCLSFIYPVMNITKVIVHEKETRMKEFMKMMGLPNWLHWTAWFIKAIVFLTITVTLLTLLVKLEFAEGRAVLTKASGTLLFAVLMCQMLTLVAYCFLLSTIFSSSNSAATSAGFLWIFLFLPYSFVFPRINTLTRSTKYMSCFLITNVPVSYATQIFAMFEGIGNGMDWEHINVGVTPDDNFSVLDCMIMMLVNGTIYALAAFYIELVWPGNYGVGLPWYFPFTTWYWEGKSPPPDDVPFQPSTMSKFKNTFFEPAPPGGVVGADILGLTKVYGKKTAVNNLNIKFYENQITALLGHNGAGKTTTMSMLTGMLTPSKGTAIVNGHDICTDMPAVRASLGMCPQYDILFDDLTVEEHLRFFSLLKGYNEMEADVEVERMLDALGFEAKREALSSTLSGGMKRKLSVGIAFCAGSKVVLLDEPSSGMDPGARRSTWDLIQTEKIGRTVILSTHFMEEADLLGDKIAVMANGDLKCCGSSLFLKNRYGGDYRLIIVKRPDCRTHEITNVIRRQIASVEISQDVGAELSYSLPSESSTCFASIFQELEDKKDELGISSYGVGSTTMEEVFMRAGNHHSSAASGDGKSTTRSAKVGGGMKKSASIHSTLSRKTASTVQVASSKSFSSEKQLMLQQSLDAPRNKGLAKLKQQFWAMFTKKALLSLRNRNLAVLQIIIPLALLTNCIFALKTIPDIDQPRAHTVSMEKFEVLGRTTTAVSCESLKDPVCRGYKAHVGEKYKIEEVRGTTFLDFILDKELEDLPKTESQYMVGFEQRSKSTFDRRSTKSMELVGYFNNQPFHTPPLALNFVSNAVLRGFGIKNRITVINHPFNYAGVDDVKQSGNFFTGPFLISWIIAFGNGFLVGSYILFPVAERASKAKHLQFVAGIRYPVYWTVSYLMDLVSYTVVCGLIMLELAVLNMKDFIEWEVVGGFFILGVGSGWASISMMSLFSFAFTIPASGYARMVAINASLGLLSMLIVTILDNPEFDIGDVTNVLHNVFLVSPSYAFGMGICQLTNAFKLHQLCEKMDLEQVCRFSPDFACCTKYQESYYAWEPLGIGRNLLSVFVFGLVCTTILAILESRVWHKCKALVQTQNEWETAVSTSEDDQLDDDVQAEKHRINSKTLAGLDKTDALILRNVTKVYDNKFMAVDHLTFGIRRGETFGLLGVNGAGKTTTFKMMTGDIAITQGDAYLAKYSVRKNIQKVHQNLGYCPQFDALVEQLTCRENMRMFARLRGIKENKIEAIINQLGENLIFSQHMDKQVGDLSGGNKRKLSTAIAMLGNPQVVFLDEPTTGMDPVARRHVWNAISAIRDQGTSVVLTSHSMEECEALCSQIAIMVNGKFQCLGSPQHLKNKFGEGYTIVAQLAYTGTAVPSRPETALSESSSTEELNVSGPRQWELELFDLKQYIESELDGCQLTDTHPGFVQYHVSGQEMTWAKLFSVMEKAKDLYKLEAYSVGQTSLDQVFFNFTQMQNSYED